MKHFGAVLTVENVNNLHQSGVEGLEVGESLMAIGRKTPCVFLTSWNTMQNIISINNR